MSFTSGTVHSENHLLIVLRAFLSIIGLFSGSVFLKSLNSPVREVIVVFV